MVKVILKNGTETTLEAWQKLYGLPVGSDKIGFFFGTKDPKIKQDINDYGVVVINEMLIRLLDAFRKRVDRPVNINAFNRNEAKQKQLLKSGYRAATYSPHVVYMAADIDTLTALQTRQWVEIMLSIAKELNIKIRVGFKKYLEIGQTFIHVDVCPEYYAAGKPYHTQTHPQAWELSYLTW